MKIIVTSPSGEWVATQGTLGITVRHKEGNWQIASCLYGTIALIGYVDGKGDRLKRSRSDIDDIRSMIDLIAKDAANPLRLNMEK